MSSLRTPKQVGKQKYLLFVVLHVRVYWALQSTVRRLAPGATQPPRRQLGSAGEAARGSATRRGFEAFWQLALYNIWE